jgi:hypothetical protein
LKFYCKTNKITIVLILSLFGITGKISAQYAVGDFGSTASNDWSTSGTWSTWNGASWVATGSTPSAANNVFILTGKTVTVSVSGSACKSLTVETGAKLWTSSGTNTYINVYGSSMVCNGTIGNGAIFDGISFNIEGATCTITGTGAFDASRMRKTFATAPITNLTISCNINLRWNAASGTQLYNGTGAAGASVFNVTISTGYTVTLVPNGAITGNVSIDGLDGGATASPFETGGTFTINGTLLISGKLYLSTNNTNTTYKCNWIINGLVQASEVISPSSGTAGHTLTINAGGKLDINGTLAWSALSPTNNTFTFQQNSTIEYSAAGPQLVRVAAEFAAGSPVPQQYGYLILNGTGLKSTSTAGPLWIKNDLLITGSAILDPNPNVLNIFVGGNWFNYNETGFLEKSTTVYMNGTNPTQMITCPGGEVYYTLRYANSFLLAGNTGHIQFNNNVDIINQLIFASNGYVDLNSNTLKIRNPLTTGIAGGGQVRYIVSEKTDNSSKIIWQIGTNNGTYTFPFGVAPGGFANYIPVVITKSGSSSIGDLSLSTYGTPPDNLPWPSTPTSVTNLQAFFSQHNVPDNRHWTVDRFWEVGSTSPTTLDSLRFSYRQSELPDSDATPANLGAQFWNSTYWFNQQYGIPTAYNVGVPSFFVFNTSWTLTSLISPLPIKLLDFEANAMEKKVRLDWITASEINNDYFTVEKSIDNKEFFEVGKIAGSGTTSTTHDYFLDDPNPVMGISYYRLRQTDFDGTFTYSKTIAVNYKKQFSKYTIFPNPANDIAYIVSGAGINPEIIIRDAQGKLIREFYPENSNPLVPVELSELKQGIYFIELKTDFDSQFLKLIKN